MLCANKVRVDDFYVTETMGIECTPKYGSCWRGKCPVGGKQYTLWEEAELHQYRGRADISKWLLYSKITLDERPPWTAHNKIAASAMLKSTERSLTESPKYADTYCFLIQDMVEKDVQTLLQDKITSFEGPVFYPSHHDLLKPYSYCV